MAEVQKLRSLVAKLKKLRAKAQADGEKPSVAVGYHAAYALYVHENVEMKWQGLPRRPPAKGEYWGPDGKAKFLEDPFRQLSNDGTVESIVTQAIRNGKTLGDGLLLAGLRVQRESQEQVPIDTGNLKNSAFTVREDRA